VLGDLCFRRGRVRLARPMRGPSSPPASGLVY
jgi:hypothetical protein